MKKVCVYVLFVSVFSSKAMEEQERTLRVFSEEVHRLCRMDDERDKALSIQNKIAKLCQKDGDVENYGELKVEDKEDKKGLRWIEFSCEEDGLQVLVSVLKNRNNGQVCSTASCVRGFGYCTYSISLEASPSLVKLLEEKRAANKLGHTVTFNTRKN
jgi:hypothetical protein